MRSSGLLESEEGVRSGWAAALADRCCKSVLEPVLSVLFPPRCVGCGDFETYLCESCREMLVDIGAHACPRCGEPDSPASLGGRCAACMSKELVYAGARGAFRHQGVARRLVAEFKFGGQPILGRLMAELARPAFGEFVERIGRPEQLVLTWVPCHRRNQRERGYNQAEILSRWLASGPDPLARVGLVEKTLTTGRQKALGREGRQHNLEGAFSMVPGATARIPSRAEAVLLVDDVLTTGATAREVSEILRRGTGLSVYVFTFSRAVAGTPERHD